MGFFSAVLRIRHTSKNKNLNYGIVHVSKHFNDSGFLKDVLGPVQCKRFVLVNRYKHCNSNLKISRVCLT